MPEDAPPSVDLAHLAQYTGGDRALDGEVLQLFIRQTSAMLAQLPGIEDAETWHRIVHSLKGAARGIGAFALADIAAEAEPLDPAAQRAQTEAILPRLMAGAEAVQVFVESYLAG